MKIQKENSKGENGDYAAGLIFRRLALAGAIMLFLATALFAVSGRIAYAYTPPTAGLVGHWRFDGDVTDSSVNGNHGTVHNAPGYSADVPAAIQTGNPQSIGFNGSNQYVTIPGDAALKPSSLSVSVWAKSNTTNWNNYGWIINFEPTGYAPGYIIHPNAGGKSVTVYVGNNSTNKAVTCTPANITDWHHYAFTLDDNALRFYIDGNECNNTSTVGFNIAYPGGPIYIGRDPCCGARYGSGRVDELRIYDRALSPSEVAVLAGTFVDSDGDGVADGEDDYPNDGTRAVTCEPGYYGAFDCAPAPMGFFVASAGALAAQACPAGKFSNQIASIACTPAPPGKYVAISGAIAATSCDPGTYQDQAGQISCKDAEPGTYVSTSGAAAATLCDPGTYQDQVGQISCKDAETGTYVAGSGAAEATQCVPGTYQAQQGQISCKLAEVGTYVSGSGAAVATACAPGTYQDQVGQTSCVPAAIGFYVPNTGSVAATPCPSGSTTAAAGSTSLADCNYPPTADAGGPYLAAVNQQIIFDGAGSSDPEGYSLTEVWTAVGGTVSASTFTAGSEAGIFNVCLTVSDSIANSQPNCTMVVVYDPSAGFVTGGGWIDSPAGAFKADESLNGKANFGFVAKYKKGANVPDGNTQFQFKAGDLNFHSSSYEWLVVAGNKAQFKGAGTINGQEGFTFMLSADDDHPDTFRMQIWGDGLVYDNGSQQALGGGSIKVHN